MIHSRTTKTVFSAIASLVVLTTLALPARADTIAVSTFDTGASGWSSISVKANPNDDHPNFNDVLQDYAVTWSGGAINEVDQDSGWQYFSASSAFLGDQSAALGGTFSFDLLRTDDYTSFPAQTGPALAITSGKKVLVFSTTASYPSTSGWTSYSFGLTTAGGEVFDGSENGALATQAQLDKVLSDLTGVYILADWYTGIGDSYSLDNVVLSSTSASVPDPSSWVLLLTTGGLAFLAVRRTRSC
jgi:hypothetical protein